MDIQSQIISLCLELVGSKASKIYAYGSIEENSISLNNLLDDSENKAKNLEDILKNWYVLHQDAYWYDTHKLKNDTYCGYWSFELGAIAKILQLDDKELKEQQYYPYDLVHFNE